MEIKFDERRKLAIPGNNQATIDYAVEHWIKVANESIARFGNFAVALSGGSTPKLIFEELVKNKGRVDWSKVLVFWSDERAAPPTDKESNYHMAMMEAGLQNLPIPKENIFRMVAESDIEKNALAYENLIKEKLKRPFDLIMLGMGEDGHTASLFPHTKALEVIKRLVVANHVPQKNTWRMSFTFECINQAAHIVLYALGSSKASILEKVLTGPFNPDEYPSQRVGTTGNPALFILDEEAFSSLKGSSSVNKRNS